MKALSCRPSFSSVVFENKPRDLNSSPGPALSGLCQLHPALCPAPHTLAMLTFLSCSCALQASVPSVSSAWNTLPHPFHLTGSFLPGAVTSSGSLGLVLLLCAPVRLHHYDYLF